MSVALDRAGRLGAYGSTKLLMAGVALLAYVVRLVPVLAGGGLGYYGNYDDGVYYSAADALSFGRVPYRDFVLLHPPGILVVLAPFVLLGRLTSDPAGMAVARLAFMAVGALNAVLVAAIALRWGRRSAIAGGILYACWQPAVYSERSTLLEPLGTTALLIALLLLLRMKAAPPSGRAVVLAGVVLGLACTLKIWYVAPWVVVLLYQLATRRWGAALRIAAGGAVAVVIVLLPFFILAPVKFWDMVVRDQLLRPQPGSSHLSRLSNILGVQRLPFRHLIGQHLITLVALAVLVTAVVICWTDRAARILVAVLVGNLIVLMASPTFFGHYSELTAGPAALVIAVALGRRFTRAWVRPVWGVAFAVSVVAFLLSGALILTTHSGAKFPGAQFAAAAPPGCITADDPQGLIQMNRLSQDFRQGCPVAIDVTGITYDSLRRVKADGRTVARSRNTAFQSYLHDYLLSGKAFVILRAKGDGVPASAPLRALMTRPALAQGNGLVLRRGAG